MTYKFEHIVQHHELVVLFVHVILISSFFGYYYIQHGYPRLFCTNTLKYKEEK